MGKPFESELKLIPRTYSWANSAEIDSWSRFRKWTGPLLAVGSGGAFTAATFAAYVHEYATSTMAGVATPLGFTRSTIDLRNVAVVLFSAGGKNPDVLQACRICIEREPAAMFVMSGDAKAPLVKYSEQYEEGTSMVFDSPAGNDGFLATNSLIAMAALMYRLRCGELPRLGEVECRMVPRHIDSAEIFQRETICVLYGDATRTAAVDLESKLSEASLGACLLSDFRNFAHGRHVWTAKRPDSTAVISFESATDRQFADRTIGLLPEDVPVLRVQSDHDGPNAALGALISVIQIVGGYGRNKNIDPGRPGVPPFGRKIYNLKFGRSAFTRPPSVPRVIARKSSLPNWRHVQDSEIKLANAVDAFIDGLQRARFGALVVDYDGTVCSPSRRFSTPENDVISQIQRLLNSGMTIGVATGRGKSVRKALRQVLSHGSWHNVIIGYYNGSVIRQLDDESEISGDGAAIWPQSVSDVLRKDPILCNTCDIAQRSTQVTVTPKANSLSETELWMFVQSVLTKAGYVSVKIVSSTHSIDVIDNNCSKTNLFPRLREHIASNQQILSIGDRGRWPGNDCELLANRYGLSVDDVSPDPDTCWNIAPAGLRGSRALLYYLKRLKKSRNGFKFVVPEKLA